MTNIIKVFKTILKLTKFCFTMKDTNAKQGVDFMNFKLIDGRNTKSFYADTIIDAIRYSMDTEKTLSDDTGKALYSIYFDCDKNDELLSEFGIIRDENNQFIYTEENLNHNNSYIYTEILKDTIEQKDYVRINIRDYNINNMYNPCKSFNDIIKKAEDISTTFNIPPENIVINDKAVNNTFFKLSDLKSDYILTNNKKLSIHSINEKDNTIMLNIFLSSYDCMRLNLDSSSLSNHFDIKLILNMKSDKIENIDLINENGKHIDYIFKDTDKTNLQSLLNDEFKKAKKFAMIKKER